MTQQNQQNAPKLRTGWPLHIQSFGQYICQWCGLKVEFIGTNQHPESCRGAIIAWLLAEHLSPAQSGLQDGSAPK